MRLPMFPLGTVLLPYARLPLHVFEPRYRALARHCLAEGGEFGVVLIERGSEVGGGDARFAVATVARITQAVLLEDGRYLLDTVGTRRVRILTWLDDAPYPLAEVEPFEEQPATLPLEGRRLEVERLLRRVLALQAELGEAAPDATVALHDDPLVAGYEAAILAPLGVLDLQRLLEQPGPAERLEALCQLLGEAFGDLSARLATDGP